MVHFHDITNNKVIHDIDTQTNRWVLTILLILYINRLKLFFICQFNILKPSICLVISHLYFNESVVIDTYITVEPCYLELVISKIKVLFMIVIGLIYWRYSNTLLNLHKITTLLSFVYPQKTLQYSANHSEFLCSYYTRSYTSVIYFRWERASLTE